MLKSIMFNDILCQPTKVLCVGRNYVNHAKELNNPVPRSPVIFMKPNSAVSNELNLQRVLSSLEECNQEIHYETELVLLIKEDQIAGIGLGLDLTLRKLQRRLKEKGLPWERSKSFDNSAVFTNFLPINEQQLNDSNIEFSLYLNEKRVQHGNISEMIFAPRVIMDDICSFVTLEDHDLIMTGTPEGVGVIKQSDRLFVELMIDGKTVLKKTWTANL